MAGVRNVWRLALMLAVLVASAAMGAGPASAADLDDYRWERRPLLLLAPADNDSRVLETLSRIEATQCEFDAREMVLGVVVTEGSSTLDGQAIAAEESQRLTEQYSVGENTFSAVLIGKDGGQKFRVDEVPDLRTIYAVVDGMPMRGNEMSANPNPC